MFGASHNMHALFDGKFIICNVGYCLTSQAVFIII